MGWNPDATKMGKGEIVGRRVFENDLLKESGKEATKREIKISAFLEGHYAARLSVDRIGQGQVVQSVIRFLTPLADNHGKNRIPPLEFEGWARLLTNDFITDHPVIPKPENNNPYHAEIDRSEAPNKKWARTLAFRLVAHARKFALIKPIRKPSKNS